ncbi:alkaline phosphatase D family protein [Aureliella helgolandensis]|uniref:Alkaline phosphatase D n=1 Tax=Aureliella helgolandensis TaxID=2527968 RepID=A0A518G589_9BACT|nr:alkaline phosphatase D family protein [Aureliella helgolandensis]QDV23756.1 Alkaline phosphatase D precursor [Aureliella helgolandensis]
MREHFHLNQLLRATKSGLSRRDFLSFTTALTAIPCLSRASWARNNPSFASDPFTLGVASGDPDSTGMVLWTRLAPQPLEPFGGMPNEAVNVHWEIAEDEHFRSIVASGTATATPQLGHSVHVEVASLKPDRWYWYRFTAGDAQSPVGRTRTTPAPDTLPPQLKFAFASCQNYEQGYFTAYEQMAQDDLDLVVHLGDYIYEYGGKENRVRKHLGEEIESLTDYRVRHSQYRADKLLQNMHAQCPWLVTWDDHEFDNNCAADISEQQAVHPDVFLMRRANAYQAYYEMMPLRASSMPRGADMTIYRRAPFGRLADFMVLDTRQYRSDQPNQDRHSDLNESAMSPTNSLLGHEQRNWLCSSLIQNTAQWNILAQQVMMGMVDRSGDSPDPVYSMDQWPGCSFERMELLKFLADRRVSNPVVLTGDIHSNWVNDLRVDDRDQTTEVIATEFVGTSISSGGNGRPEPDSHPAIMADNPCVQFHNTERGYVRCTVTPEQWQSDYVVIDDITKPGGKASTRAQFLVETGHPGAHRIG